jgi:hypothetical protein
MNYILPTVNSMAEEDKNSEIEGKKRTLYVVFILQLLIRADVLCRNYYTYLEAVNLWSQ